MSQSSLTNYNPSFDHQLFGLTDLTVPTNIKEVFRVCQYLVTRHEVVSPAVHMLAEAPVTDLLYDHAEEAVQERYRTLMEQKLGLFTFLPDLQVDAATYSNHFSSLDIEVTRYLVSPSVSRDFDRVHSAFRHGDMKRHQFEGWYKEQIGMPRAKRLPDRFRIEALDWHFDRHERVFKGKCPITQDRVSFGRLDRYYHTPDHLRLVRWDPNQISIVPNVFTGKNRYYYKIDDNVRQLIRDSDRDYLSKTPWDYIEAALDGKDLEMDSNAFHHHAGVKVSGVFRGWGVPRLLSALKIIYYHYLLLRANEAIAIGKVNDLPIVFPQSRNAFTGDPSGMVTGTDFSARLRAIIKNFQKDRNYTGFMPIPIGIANLYGNGRMQLVSQEAEMVVRSICTAIGVPYELLYGGGRYSGQAIDQRMFAAQTGMTREKFANYMTFLVRRAHALLGDAYPPDCRITLRADEGPEAIQRKQLILNASQSNFVSRQAGMDQLDLDYKTEIQRMIEEAKDMAELAQYRAMADAYAQSKAQRIMSIGQMRMEQDMQQAAQQGMMGAGGMGGDPSGMMGGPQGPGGPAGGGPGAGPEGGPQQGGPGQGGPPGVVPPVDDPEVLQQQVMQILGFVEEKVAEVSAPQEVQGIVQFALEYTQQHHPYLMEPVMEGLKEMGLLDAGAAPPSTIPDMPSMDAGQPQDDMNAEMGRMQQAAEQGMQSLQPGLYEGASQQGGVQVSKPQPEQLPPRRNVGGI